MSLVQQGSLSTYLVLTSSCDGASQSLDGEVSVGYLLAHVFYLVPAQSYRWQLHQPGVWPGRLWCLIASVSEGLRKEFAKVNKSCSLL